jgi:putative transposase
MRTHYHLILDVDDGALARGMHALNFRYAVLFNERHRMRGHVHGARYGSTRLDDDPELLRAFRYVARNPVEANICDSPTDWPWSSYASAVGLAEPHSSSTPA